MEVILHDICQNRQRVEDIIKQMTLLFENGDNEEEERLKAIQRLLTHKLISDEQYDNLKENIGDMDFDAMISELKNTKIGRGLSFLPTTIRKQKENIGEWLREFAEKKSKQLRDKLFGVLNEVLQRKGISKQEYKETLEQNDLD